VLVLYALFAIGADDRSSRLGGTFRGGKPLLNQFQNLKSHTIHSGNQIGYSSNAPAINPNKQASNHDDDSRRCSPSPRIPPQ
jgi:hypothetical protein